MAKIKEEVNKVYSEELDEVINKPPSWLLKSGISFIFFMTLVLLSLTYFIPIPVDKITSKISIENSLSDEIISSKVNAGISKTFVKDAEYISKNTLIAFVESSANHNDVLRLLDTLKEINNKKNIVEYSKIKLPIFTTLGELQASYNELHELLNLKKINDLPSYKKSELSNEQDSETIKSLIGALTEECYAKEEKLILIQSKKITGGDPKLRAEFVLELKESIQLLKDKIDTLKKMQLNKKNAVDKNRKIELNFFNALTDLISKIELWKSKFIISNKTEGKIVFLNPLQKKAQIGQKLFCIYPVKSEAYAQLVLTENFRTKIKLGEKIQLKFKSNKKNAYVGVDIKYIAPHKIGKQFFPVHVSLDSIPKDIQDKLSNVTQVEVRLGSTNMLEKIWQNIVKSKKI